MCATSPARRPSNRPPLGFVRAIRCSPNWHPVSGRSQRRPPSRDSMRASDHRVRLGARSPAPVPLHGDPQPRQAIPARTAHGRTRPRRPPACQEPPRSPPALARAADEPHAERRHHATDQSLALRVSPDKYEEDHQRRGPPCPDLRLADPADRQLAVLAPDGAVLTPFRGRHRGRTTLEQIWLTTRCSLDTRPKQLGYR